MSGLGASQLELAFEISEGHIEIVHCHLGIDVAE